MIGLLTANKCINHRRTVNNQRTTKEDLICPLTLLPLKINLTLNGAVSWT